MTLLPFLELLHHLPSSKKLTVKVKKGVKQDMSDICGHVSVRQKLWLRKTNVTFKLRGSRKSDIELLKHWILISSVGPPEKKAICGLCYQLCGVFFGLNMVGSQFHWSI